MYTKPKVCYTHGTSVFRKLKAQTEPVFCKILALRPVVRVKLIRNGGSA